MNLGLRLVITTLASIQCVLESLSVALVVFSLDRGRVIDVTKSYHVLINWCEEGAGDGWWSPMSEISRVPDHADYADYANPS